MWRGSVSQAKGVRRVPGGERGMSKGQVGASQVRRAEGGRQVNHFSEAWTQASEETSKVSDCPVSGSRTERETQTGSHQTVDTKEPQHLHKGPAPHGLGARLT